MSLDVSIPNARIRDLTYLRAGETIEARNHSVVVYRGQVEETAPGIGVVWIRLAGSGERKLIHLGEYSVWFSRRD